MAKKVFILTELMRSSKSGFFIAGTDIQMDFPDQYPIPLETEVLENGMPVALRVLPGCGYLEKEKQIKNGYPANFKWSQNDRKRITFDFRRLELDEVRDKIYLDYIERSAWMAGNEGKKTRDTTKTIYELYDEDALLDQEINDELLITNAKTLVFGLGDSDIRNLYRLANPGRNEGLMKVSQMRKHLIDVSNSNPAFIINGIKTNRDRMVIMVTRAIEKNIISLDFPGTVALFNDKQNAWQNLINVSDLGGPEEKFDRLIDYLSTEEGAPDYAVIESKVEETELEPAYAEDGPPAPPTKPARLPKRK